MIEKKDSKDNRTYLCFDLGTTRIKSALINSSGNIIYLDSEEASTYHSRDSVFQKPEDYYKVVEDKIKRIARNYKKVFESVDSLICSGQMAGVLSIDRNWEVVFPWTYSIDSRANGFLENIEKNMAARIRSSSGGMPFMAAKIKWIKSEFPVKYKRSYKFINLATYVAGRLAGLSADEAFIDFSVLGMSGLADIKKGIWNKGIIESLDLDISKLPEISSPYRVVGTISKVRFGTKNDIKVLCGIGDQIAGFIGAGILKKGDLVDVAGTYTVMGYATDHFIPDVTERIISSIYSGLEDLYYHLAVVTPGGFLYKWFIERFSYNDAGLHRKINAESLYFIPHIDGRLAPFQPYYKGTIYGLRWDHNLDSMYTAMLECIGYENDFIYNKINKLNNLRKKGFEKIKVIGGGAGNLLWNKIKANILELEYMVMKDTSFEILGNYLIARYGNDVKKGYKDLSNKNIVKILKKIKPEKQKIGYYHEKKDRYRKIVDRIGKIYRDFRE